MGLVRGSLLGRGGGGAGGGSRWVRGMNKDTGAKRSVLHIL